MKGLLIKDFKLIKNQATFLIFVILISIACSAVMKSPFFAMGYATSLISIFSISSISYDDYDNGMAYLFSLPISRKLYVKEKYIYALLLAFIALTVSLLISVAVALVLGMQYAAEEWMMLIMMSLSLVIVIFSFLLPVRLKYDVEKHKMAMMAAVGAMVLAAGLVFGAASALGIDLEAALDHAMLENPWAIVLVAMAVGVILILISYRISLKIMRNKEF